MSQKYLIPMYELTLTHAERAAIDWIGNRYHNGNDLYLQLWVYSTVVPDDVDWDGEADLTFHIPEYVAWKIKEQAEAEGFAWPCFSEELAWKMTSFIHSIT